MMLSDHPRAVCSFDRQAAGSGLMLDQVRFRSAWSTILSSDARRFFLLGGGVVFVVATTAFELDVVLAENALKLSVRFPLPATLDHSLIRSPPAPQARQLKTSFWALLERDGLESSWYGHRPCSSDPRMDLTGKSFRAISSRCWYDNLSALPIFI